MAKKKSRTMLTPEVSEESVHEVIEPEIVDSSSGDEDNYKNKAYWSLPENVRNAIDLSKKKSKHSDFYSKLNSLNDKIGVYKRIFYTNTPKFEVKYREQKR